MNKPVKKPQNSRAINIMQTFNSAGLLYNSFNKSFQTVCVTLEENIPFGCEFQVSHVFLECVLFEGKRVVNHEM